MNLRDELALSQNEQVLWEGRPSPAVFGIWLFTKVIPATFAASFITFWVFGFFGGMWAATKRADEVFNPFALALPTLFVLAPLCFAGALAYCWRLRITFRYVVTNQRVVFNGGVLVRKRRSVHYHKVTDMEVSQNLLEQLLDIRTLKIFTAGTSSFAGWPWGGERAEITYPGLREVQVPEQIINNTLRSYRATGE